MIDNKREIITRKQATFLVIIFTIGTSIITTGTMKAKQDIWISIILAIIAILPILFIYGKILSLYPGKNIFEILNLSCGKIVGKIISFLYIVYFIYLGSLWLRNITEFIQAVSLRHTPQYFSGLWIILVSAYMVKSGIEVFGRWANMACLFLLILILLITLASINHFDLDNLLPVLYNGWRPVLESSLTLFSFPFGEVVVFLALTHRSNSFTYFPTHVY